MPASPDGTFSLALPAGPHWLRVSATGFAPESILVTVPAESLLIVMHQAAQALAAVRVVEASPDHRWYVPASTVRSTPGFLENDVFRALTFVPGVSQPNDLKGRLHLAGSASDETGFTLDGHPLQEPFHLAGLTGALQTSALDRASVTTHHLSPAIDGRLGGVVAFETATDREPGAELAAGLISMASAANGAWRGGRVAGVLAARTTFIDQFLEQAHKLTDERENAFPIVQYRDLTGSLRLGSRTGSYVQGTVFMTGDRFSTSGSGADPLALRWGERLAGIRARWRTGGGTLTSRASLSAVRQDRASGGGLAVMHLSHDFVSSALSWERPLAPASLVRLGATYDHRAVNDRWDVHGLSELDVILSPRLPLAGATRGTQGILAGFAEWKTRIRDTDMEAGMRLSRFPSGVTLEPRLEVRHPGPGGTRVALGLDRRFQGDALLEEPQEFNLVQPLFLLERFRQADVASLVLSRPPGTRGRVRWDLSAHLKRLRAATSLASNVRAYVDSTGALPDPFPPFARSAGSAYGVRTDLQWPASSRLFLQASYAWQRAFARVDGRAPTDWDVPHEAALFMSHRLSPHWSLSGTARFHSGLPLTPAIGRTFAPGLDLGPLLTSRFIAGRRNSARTGSYFRSDLHVQREWSAVGATWSAGLDILNATGRVNPLSYDYRGYACWLAGACGAPRAARSGMPFLPSLFISARW